MGKKPAQSQKSPPPQRRRSSPSSPPPRSTRRSTPGCRPGSAPTPPTPSPPRSSTSCAPRSAATRDRRGVRGPQAGQRPPGRPRPGAGPGHGRQVVRRGPTPAPDQLHRLQDPRPLGRAWRDRLRREPQALRHRPGAARQGPQRLVRWRPGLPWFGPRSAQRAGNDLALYRPEQGRIWTQAGSTDRPTPWSRGRRSRPTSGACWGSNPEEIAAAKKTAKAAAKAKPASAPKPANKKAAKKTAEVEALAKKSKPAAAGATNVKLIGRTGAYKFSYRKDGHTRSKVITAGNDREARRTDGRADLGVARGHRGRRQVRRRQPKKPAAKKSKAAAKQSNKVASGGLPPRDARMGQKTGNPYVYCDDQGAGV
jgi:hypothetical protein